MAKYGPKMNARKTYGPVGVSMDIRGPAKYYNTNFITCFDMIGLKQVFISCEPY